MATSAKVALRPENEAPRRPYQGERGTTVFFNNSVSTDSEFQAQSQALASRLGLTVPFACAVLTLLRREVF